MTIASDKSTRRPILGCIADDVTGATDLAINLVQGGMCAVQVFGVPTATELAEIDAEAIVVALKSRSIDRGIAIDQSLRSLTALREAGVERFYFKYCSTFDSTEHGNIGPVAEALMRALDAEQTIFCPAFPRNGRTVYQGHLFVNGQLLNESGMEKHPLNPMSDANLVRVLGKQTTKRVGLVPYETIAAGAVRSELLALAEASVELVIVDACDDDQLAAIASDVADMRLVTGGSGIARYLPAAWRESGLLNADEFEASLPAVNGRMAILAGSCSSATIRQVAFMKSKCPSMRLDIPAVMSDSTAALSDVVTWSSTAQPSEPILIYSTSNVDEVTELQHRYGVKALALAIEEFIAAVAFVLVTEHRVRRLVLAGGETSGAVVERLGVRSIRIGPEICTGVPWTESIGGEPLALALKSGNFGEENFFESALEMIA